MHKRMDQAFMRKCGGAVFPVFIFAFDFSFFGEKFFFTQNPKDPPARPGRTERKKYHDPAKSYWHKWRKV